MALRSNEHQAALSRSCQGAAIDRICSGQHDGIERSRSCRQSDDEYCWMQGSERIRSLRALSMIKRDRRLGMKKDFHGHNFPGRRSRTYVTWDKMMTRCLSPNGEYKKKGITVCDRWRSFANFLADMGERPLGTSIDRYPNMDGDYEPGNCRWATPKQQINNRHNSFIIEAGGIKHTTSEWSDITGIKILTLYFRIRRGWTPERAVSTPVEPRIYQRRTS